MRHTTIRKNVPVEVDDVRARYDVVKVADPTSGSDTYAVSLSLGGGFRSCHVGDFRFDRPGKGVTIAAYAHEVAKREMRNLLNRAANDRSVYVVITDFPGFAEERLGKHQKAGYDGFGGPNSEPVYIVKAKDSIEADAIVERVEKIKRINDGGRRFSPKVTNITDHAHEALGGEPWNATDAVTMIVAQRVEDVVDGGIGV